MGQAQSDGQLSPTEMKQYMRTGITEQDVIGLYNAFQALGPIEGLIKIMAQDIADKRKRFGNIEFETNSNNEVFCVLCPYTVNKPPSQV